VDFSTRVTCGGAKIFFGVVQQAGRPEDGPIHPILARKIDSKRQALALPEKDLVNYDWQYAAAGPGKDEIWAVLDAVEDDPAEDLVLMHSTDGGSNWTSLTFKKPSDRAVYFDFAMSRDGRGR